MIQLFFPIPKEQRHFLKTEIIFKIVGYLLYLVLSTDGRTTITVLILTVQIKVPTVLSCCSCTHCYSVFRLSFYTLSYNQL